MSRFGRITVSFLALFFLIGGPSSRARAGNRSADSDLRGYATFYSEAQWAPNQGIALEDQSDADLSTPQLIEAAQRRNEIDQDTAALFIAFALGGYESLPDQYRSNVPWDGTLPLLHLRRVIADMGAGVERSAIEQLMIGSCGLSGAPMPNTFDSSNYHIEYDTIAAGLDINAYAASLETGWTTEVDSFGWAAPPVLTSNPPPGDRYHVRIDTLEGGLYGYVSMSGDHAGFVGDNPNTTWDEGDAYASCMVLNRNYSGFPGSPQESLDATTAHELNHSIQFGYGALIGMDAPDIAFTEGGATWMEDEVFDDSNDNYNFLWPEFDVCMGQYSPSPYAYWIVFRGLTEPYEAGLAGGGEQIMQDFWELSSKGVSRSLSALNSALTNANTNLNDAYHDFAVAGAFTKTCGGSYSSPYCFEEASGYVSTAGPTAHHGDISTVGSSFSGSLQDNYALNWVGLPTSGSAYAITLTNNSAGGLLRASAVCDTGTMLQVTAFPGLVGPGGSATLPSIDPAGCFQVVAVITNQSQTADNPDACNARSYTIETGVAVPIPSTIYLPLVLR